MPGFRAGDTVRLGNGSDGVVQGKIERAGFSGYRVKVTHSVDPEQVGKTVAATPDGMHRTASTAVLATVSLGGKDFVCEVAGTPTEKSVGLQHHSSLGDDEGMYFPFTPPQRVMFHMGTVGFPIDIVFCKKGRVVRIVANVQPGSRERWDARCDSVLELRGGWCAEHGVRVGSPVSSAVGATPKQAAQTYDLLRTLTTAQEEAPAEKKPPKPTALDVIKTFESLERAGRMPSLRTLAAEIYAIYLENDPEAVERESLSKIETDRIVQSWEGKARWLQALLRLADAKLLPGYDEDPKVYQQQFAWQLADELQQIVALAHDFFEQHRDEFEELAPHLETEFAKGGALSVIDGMYRALAVKRARRRAELARNPVYANEAQQLMLYFAPMGPSYLPVGGAAETRFYDLLDLYDGRAASQQIEARWVDVSKGMNFLDRDAVVRALVDSGYPDAVKLLKVSQMQSEPDVRQDVAQPGAVRRTPPEQAWSGNEIPADTMGVGDAADPENWDQELGYDTSAPMLLEDRVPPIRPSASRKTAGGDIHPGDRVRATEKADGLKDDQKGVCLEVQGDMVWIKFDGEPVPRWLKNDMLTQDKEKEQVLQEMEQEQQGGGEGGGKGGGGEGGGGLAGLLGAMG